jgi:hypothetical protein
VGACEQPLAPPREPRADAVLRSGAAAPQRAWRASRRQACAAAPSRLPLGVAEKAAAHGAARAPSLLTEQLRAARATAAQGERRVQEPAAGQRHDSQRALAKQHWQSGNATNGSGWGDAVQNWDAGAVGEWADPGDCTPVLGSPADSEAGDDKGRRCGSRPLADTHEGDSAHDCGGLLQRSHSARP